MSGRLGHSDETSDGETARALREIFERASPHHLTVADLTSAVLRMAVVSAALGPGQRIPEYAVAEALGISRVPVRSALLRLEAEGLVDRRPHRGATVAILTPEEIRDLYEARIVLEMHAIGRTVAAMTPDRLAKLEELAASLDDRGSKDSFLETREAFYRTLYAAGANEVMVDLIMRLRGQMGRYWTLQRVVHNGESPHVRLLAFVRRGDADGACQWLDHHLRQVAELRALSSPQEMATQLDAPETGRIDRSISGS
jgi:DNA-binding GntR family transcriptional regulator